MKTYFKEISRYPILTPEQEKKIAIETKTGNLKSRELLINSHLRLVVSIAKKYNRKGNLDDLIQQGNLGLVKAADKFKPELGFRFSTYSSWWIKQGIFSYFEKNDLIRLSSGQRTLKKKIYDFVEEHVGINGKEPSVEEIAKKLNTPDKKKYNAGDIQRLLQRYELVKVGSLDRVIEGKNLRYIDFVTGDDGKQMIKDILSNSTVKEIYKQVQNLDLEDTTKNILKSVLFNHKKFKELSNQLGLSREQVRQKYEICKRMLRNVLRNGEIIEEDF